MRNGIIAGTLVAFAFGAIAAAQTYPYAAYCPFSKTVNGVESALDIAATETNCTAAPRNGIFSIIGNTGSASVFCYVANRNAASGVCQYVPNTYNRVCPDNDRYLNRAKTAANCAAEGGTFSVFVAPDPNMKICRLPSSSDALVCAYYDYFLPISACVNGTPDRPATAAACAALPDTFFDTVTQTCRSERPIAPQDICRYQPQTITCPAIPFGLMDIDPAGSAARCTAAGGTPLTSNGPPPAAQCTVRGTATIFTVCAYRPAPIRPQPPITPPYAADNAIPDAANTDLPRHALQHREHLHENHRRGSPNAKS